ncbi:MAG: hypothetical protein AB7N91_32200 [Candidatus Tectimicrobiota bacterium]
MSEATPKTFKVTCIACQKPFHVRFPLAQPGASGSAEVVVACLYCAQQVVVTLPREYIETEHLIRGLPSRAMES